MTILFFFFPMSMSRRYSCFIKNYLTSFRFGKFTKETMEMVSRPCSAFILKENGGIREFWWFSSWFLFPHNEHNLSLSLSLSPAMRETKEALDNVNVGLEVLQEGTGRLNFNLSLVRTGINRTLSDPGCRDEDSDATTAQLCRNIRQSLSLLQIGANFTRVQNRMQTGLRSDLRDWWTFVYIYTIDQKFGVT